MAIIQSRYVVINGHTNTEMSILSFISVFQFIFTAPVAQHRRYGINQRKSEALTVGKMENIEKCSRFVISVYDPIHSVSGKLHEYLLALEKKKSCVCKLRLKNKTYSPNDESGNIRALQIGIHRL